MNGKRFMTIALLAAGLAGAAAAQDVFEDVEKVDDVDREWEFRVLLDGSEIGSHLFRLEQQQDRKLLKSEAQFDVKFLFFTAFSYRHRNYEEWADDCLLEIDARTVTNGKTQVVEGEKEGDAFVIETDSETEKLPGCVMTFAYWNPDFLSEPRLLNPQTGEFLDVEVTPQSTETLTVRGESRQAKRYDLKAKDIQLSLWYSQDDNEWLALQSTVKGGRIMRYELI